METQNLFQDCVTPKIKIDHHQSDIVSGNCRHSSREYQNLRVNLIKWMTLVSLSITTAVMIFNLQQLKRDISNYDEGRIDFTMFDFASDPTILL